MHTFYLLIFRIRPRQDARRSGFSFRNLARMGGCGYCLLNWEAKASRNGLEALRLSAHAQEEIGTQIVFARYLGKARTCRNRDHGRREGNAAPIQAPQGASRSRGQNAPSPRHRCRQPSRSTRAHLRDHWPRGRARTGVGAQHGREFCGTAPLPGTACR